MDKLEVARRELGTATQLYLDGKDPVSVHVLASAAWEIAEGLAQDSSEYNDIFSNILVDGSEITKEQLFADRKNAYNAFKHYKDRHGNKRKEDQTIFDRFEEKINDTILFCGWFEYMQAGGKLPFEVHIFQIWYLGMYLDRFDTENNELAVKAVNSLFPDLKRNLDYSSCKKILRKKCSYQKLRNKYSKHMLIDHRLLIYNS